MPYFLSPKILFGKGILKRFGSEIQGRGTKATIITDKVMAKYVDKLVEAVKAAGYEVKVWDGAEPEPAVEVAEAAGKALLEFGPQLVIAYGGGSAIDTAKAAWVLYERPDLSGTELDKTASVRATLNLRKKARFVAVPTTSGTGSEITWAAILTDTTKHRKIAFANNEIVPDIALLDPEFTAGMPKSLTASTGLDVLGHAFDGYTSMQQKDFSDGLCLQAITMVFEWLPKACKDGSDLIAREKMQNAAAIAGLGFGNSNTSLSHALAHSAGATFKMGHGRMVGIALSYSLEYIISNPTAPNAPDPIKRMSTIARLMGITAGSDKEAAEKLISKIRELQKEIGEPLSLKEIGISEQQMKDAMGTLVSLAGTDVNIYSSPCPCKEDNLKQIFQAMWEGKK
jgi:alcohol dehydrogenase class IV